MTERKGPEPCRSCTCPNCEPQGTKATAERRDCWNMANERLTASSKDWPKGKDQEYENLPVTFDATDVLVLANWLYSGEVPDQ